MGNDVPKLARYIDFKIFELIYYAKNFIVKFTDF